MRQLTDDTQAGHGVAHGVVIRCGQNDDVVEQAVDHHDRCLSQAPRHQRGLPQRGRARIRTSPVAIVGTEILHIDPGQHRCGREQVPFNRVAYLASSRQSSGTSPPGRRSANLETIADRINVKFFAPQDGLAVVRALPLRRQVRMSDSLPGRLHDTGTPSSIDWDRGAPSLHPVQSRSRTARASASWRTLSATSALTSPQVRLPLETLKNDRDRDSHDGERQPATPVVLADHGPELLALYGRPLPLDAVASSRLCRVSPRPASGADAGREGVDVVTSIV